MLTYKALSHELDRARLVARHEAGHWVASRVLGMRPGLLSLELLPNNGWAGGAEVSLVWQIRSLDDVVDAFRKRIVSLMAGAIGEALDPHSKRVDPVTAGEIFMKPAGGVDQDRAKVTELANLLRGATHPDSVLAPQEDLDVELKAIFEDLWVKTINLVEAHADDILGLAANLSSRVEFVGQRYIIPFDELDALPAVAAMKTYEL